MIKTLTAHLKMMVLTCVLLASHFLQLSAAGPVTHALLADHFFRLYPDRYCEDEKMAFRAGTLFPDIRYLGQLSREDTHFNDVTIDDILSEPSPFIAGMKFHSLVDIVRENFVVQGGYYELISDLDIQHLTTYLKLLEDEIVFPSLDKGPWKEVVNTVHPDELLWGVDSEGLKRWHYLLDISFTYYPSTLIFFAHLKGNGLLDVSAEEVAVWYDTFETMAESGEVQAYVTALFKMYAAHLPK